MIAEMDREMYGNGLSAINAELAAALCGEPAELIRGAHAAFADSLVICGLLGGKDVGKSTLVNALAGRNVSVDEAEAGEGTSRPTAYVFRGAQDALIARLQSIAAGAVIDVCAHDSDALRHVVLVDLPDFDSEFEDHLRTVEGVAPVLDRVLWVTTPKKIADRAWARLVRSVVKDPRNAYCVLNKIDELLADDDPFGPAVDGRSAGKPDRAEPYWQDQRQWFLGSLRQAGFPVAEEQSFLVAAAYHDEARFLERIGILWDDVGWRKYAADRATVSEIGQRADGELQRLRTAVLSPVLSDQACTIKQSNSTAERQANVELIRRHHDVPRWLELLRQAVDSDYHRRILHECFGPPWCIAAAAAIAERIRSDRELADELLERRVEHFPLLRLVHWPLGWLSRVVGRRLGPVASATVPSGPPPIPFDERSLTDRIQSLRTRLLCDAAVIVDRLKLEPFLPEANELERNVERTTRQLAADLESRLLDSAWPRNRRPSFLGRAAVWWIAFWFPFAQPLLQAWFEHGLPTGITGLRPYLLTFVTALSAPHLLASVAMAAVVYVVLLSAMYARNLRTVRRLREEQTELSALSRLVEERLLTEVMEPLVEPFQDRRDRLAGIESLLRSCSDR